MNINKFLKEKGYEIDQKINFFGLVDSKNKRTLSYLIDEKYIEKVNTNDNVVFVLCNDELKDRVKKPHLVLDNPLVFFLLYNEFSRINNSEDRETIIEDLDLISEESYIHSKNVYIGKNTRIHPNVTILSDVYLAEDCEVLPGAVIGSDGAEFKKISGELHSIVHNGKVIIGKNVTIGANTCIDKGLFGDTIISDNVKIDNLCHIAHNVQIEKNCIILANSTICGSTKVDENTWISPSATLINGIKVAMNNVIGLGSVLFKSTRKNEVYLGNPTRRIK
tara:strand:- start:247 stop:1080 length:834 start_codon:yes stop_codon:yes gene_type:complete